MSKSMLDKMKDIITRMENMNQEELETFRSEGEARAEHVLAEVYNEERDFRIVGEEVLYCGEVVNHQFFMTSCYTYTDSSDLPQNPSLGLAA